MRRRRNNRAATRARPQGSGSGEHLNTPFAELALKLRQARGEVGRSDAEAVRPPEERQGPGSLRPAGASSGGTEECLFREAMAGVTPIRGGRHRPRSPGPLSRPRRRPLVEEELEAYTQLVDLVSGEGRFDIQQTDEYVEGAVVGVDPRLVCKLRRGDFSTQAHLDLHGMTAEEAHGAVEHFLTACVARGLRCVLVIHGRGLNSRDQIPILKERMACWLKRGRLKHLVLAFASARACDGGAGALCVLLRKGSPARG
jgi:DNA-nicking Smr family endonuclease